MRKLLLFVCQWAIFFISDVASAQSGCPGCVVTLPTLPADTIYLGAAPDGRAGEYYEADISFRMPKTTTPVAATDSSVAPGITINQITINSVSNVPPGLSWQANKTEFNVATETDGCVRFCGTPLQPGLYEVEVVVTARVFIISQTTSFSFPIYIAPARSVTEGFTMENSRGCGEVRVEFTNRVPSNGQTGFSYRWDFGNGQTSLDENPFPQTYRQPGSYVVNYQAIVDTTGHFLTGLQVAEVSCSDFLSRPDLYVEILNPQDSVVFRYAAVENTVLPLNVNLRIAIDTGDYKIRVRDDDEGLEGADDECGIATFNRASGNTLQGVDFKTTITLLHPVDTIRSRDTVQVFAQPAPPQLLGYNGQKLCEGDTLLLRTNYANNLQWFKDSTTLIGATAATLRVQESAAYRVQYTSAQGCRAISAPLFLNFAATPAVPIFINTQNQLTLLDASQLPANYRAIWSLNGNPLPNTLGTTACASASGTYVLQITDTASGCSSSYSRIVTYDPNAPCTTSAEEPFEAIGSDWRVFPNPTADNIWLEFTLASANDALVVVRNAVGAEVSRQWHRHLLGENRIAIDLTQVPAGFYWIELQVKEARKIAKIVKQ